MFFNYWHHLNIKITLYFKIGFEKLRSAVPSPFLKTHDLFMALFEMLTSKWFFLHVLCIGFMVISEIHVKTTIFCYTREKIQVLLRK